MAAKPSSPSDPALLRRLLRAKDRMDGGSQHGDSQHSGSRDITEGVTGGLGTETGGTRNYRQGTGHTGGDIGNRPE